MTKARADCKAYQASDQMYCPHCHLVWDVNDPDPPPCEIEQAEVERERANAVSDKRLHERRYRYRHG